MTTQRKAALGEEMSPHLRQRVAFIAALISDPESADWSAISDTFDDLSQDSASESPLELLRVPIQQKDALALAQVIGSLLNADLGQMQASAATSARSHR